MMPEIVLESKLSALYSLPPTDVVADHDPEQAQDPDRLSLIGRWVFRNTGSFVLGFAQSD